MSTTEYVAQAFIKIGGAQVSQEFMDAVDEVVVDASLHLPDMFTISLYDPGLKWVDGSLLAIGKEVEIKLKQANNLGGNESVLISGEITALEPHFSGVGETLLVVRGYDKSHRLHRGRYTRTFLKQSDTNIVTKIAQEVGLTPETDSTTVQYDYVLQNNQTNMEFLLERAERIGYQVLVSQGKLYFKRGEATLGEGPTLALGDTLRTFNPCWAATHQADSVTVKGWDAKGKKAITSTVQPPGSLNQGGMTSTGGSVAASAFGGAETFVTDRPVISVDDAKALAEGLSKDLARDFVEAEGECYGDPRVLPGRTVTISGVGSRFAGKYFVTSATHIYTRSDYETRFGITGRHPNTVSYLLGIEEASARRGDVRGVVTALVTNLNDPDDLGRVKVKYAWLGEIESDWVRISSPMAGSGRGLMYLPEINDEVLVAFEHGDVNRPYIVGALWSSQDAPPLPNSKATSGGKVNVRTIVTRSGHTVILDDTDGAEQIVVRDKTGNNEIVIDSAENSMSIHVAGDFTVNADGKITLNSTQDMALSSKAKMTLDSTQDLSAASKANANVKGLQLALEGTSKGELKAPMISVNGSAQTEVKGGVMVQVQGGIVKIN
ncbi:MAG: VgrG-related protein [Anaerolineae bacterium]|nr:VgrG-related protein [Anaerolineae bacterium]